MKIKPRHVKMARAAWRVGWSNPWRFSNLRELNKQIDVADSIERWHRAARGK